MKKNKLYIILSCFLFSISFILCLQTVNADSGWDSSYDSDSSWDSGSSWDSDSSWDNDYSWDSGSSGSGYSGSGDPGIAIFVFFIYIIIFAIIINVCTKKSNNNGNLESTARFRELTLEEINEVDATINKDEMDHKLFEIYKEIQIAWMNFDYDTLRKYTTDELFNMYKSQLKVLNTKKQKILWKILILLKLK